MQQRAVPGANAPAGAPPFLVVVARDPAAAAVPGMPVDAIRTGAVELVPPPARIAPALVQPVSREHE